MSLCQHYQTSLIENSTGQFLQFHCKRLAFGALTLFGHQEEHLAYRKLTDEMLAWLSGVRCTLYAYGPADAIIQNGWFTAK